MAATDGTGAGRPKGTPSHGGDSKASPSTVFSNSVPTDMPERLGRYLIKKRLGGGGMGAVYLVENTDLNREEALKVPHFESSSNIEVRERFLREARAAARLDHPNLCAIHDVGVIDGIYFLTMRYLEGKLLSAYARRPQSPGDAVKIVVRLAQALEYAHGKGVIHRDLKPGNIMICPGTGPTVMDFGLAKQTQLQDKKLTQPGMIMGTLAYMPLEQLNGDLNLIGPASDVYSLGVILFQLLTGRLPFEGSTAEIIGKLQFTEAPLPSQFRPEVNRALDAVCGKAMAKALSERYASMKDFAAALQESLQTQPVKQDPDTVATPTGSKNARGIFNVPSAPPQAILVPNGPETYPQAIPVAKPAEEPKARQEVHPRQVEDAQRPVKSRGTSIVVWLCLVLLLGGGGVIAFFSLDGGNGGGRNRSKGEDAFINDFEIQLVSVPGGTFTIGSPGDEKGRERLETGSEKQHKVEISSFLLGMHEVTQKQFRAVMDYNPSYFSKKANGKPGLMYGSWEPGGGEADIAGGDDTEDYPVENVSWEEANDFCVKLTAIDTRKPAGHSYRLPTEAEWEYACRGGAPRYHVFHFGDSLSSKQANFDGRSPYGDAGEGEFRERTCKVGSYEKNGFGLYDMHGNVWEWCHDWYSASYYGNSSAKDPRGPLVKTSGRVIRGGSWSASGRECRSAYRDEYPLGSRRSSLGFRIALVPSGK